MVNLRPHILYYMQSWYQTHCQLNSLAECDSNLTNTGHLFWVEERHLHDDLHLLESPLVVFVRLETWVEYHIPQGQAQATNLSIVTSF